jgi:hypothetical protein
MTLEERMEKIIKSAKEHEYKYLLPRRFIVNKWDKSEVDFEYDACEELVNQGKAEWL